MKKISLEMGFLSSQLTLQFKRRVDKKKKGKLTANYSLANIESAATTKKAMPVQNKSPVKKYTTIATRIAGISTRKSLMRITIIKPVITKTTKAVRSSPKLPSIE